MTDVDIRALARLARIEVSDAEVSKLEKEIPSILGFVETIQKVEVATGGEGASTLQNVMRADENPHESGVHTEALLAAAPAVRDGKVVVKQVVSRKR